MGKHPLYNTTGLQKGNKSHVLYALANKQMELKQIQDEYETKVAKIKSDLEAMEQVICLFDKDCGSTIEKINNKSTKRASPKANSYFERGEARKLVLNVLRKSQHSLKARDISQIIQKDKNIPIDDSIVNAEVTKVINDCLRHTTKSGLIVKDENETSIIHWKIKD
ncbi:MAG: hypothetical protein U9N59_15815 [Campylobacterota bacterium]|nr:hypothetical protein [Campylobacterota bacterium]